jgi:hypothetical protein
METTLAADPATQALRQSAIPAIRRLTVHGTGAELILSGRVSSYYIKQMAQEAVLPYLGGRSLVNKVVVVRQV